LIAALLTLYWKQDFFRSYQDTVSVIEASAKGLLSEGEDKEKKMNSERDIALFHY